MVEIKKEDINEAFDIIKRIISCQRNLKSCSAECTSCECNYSIEEYDKAFDVAIAVMEDVLKNTEALEAKNDISGH